MALVSVGDRVDYGDGKQFKFSIDTSISLTASVPTKLVENGSKRYTGTTISGSFTAGKVITYTHGLAANRFFAKDSSGVLEFYFEPSNGQYMEVETISDPSDKISIVDAVEPEVGDFLGSNYYLVYYIDETLLAQNTSDFFIDLEYLKNNSTGIGAYVTESHTYVDSTATDIQGLQEVVNRKVGNYFHSRLFIHDKKVFISAHKLEAARPTGLPPYLVNPQIKYFNSIPISHVNSTVNNFDPVESLTLLPATESTPYPPKLRFYNDRASRVTNTSWAEEITIPIDGMGNLDTFDFSSIAPLSSRIDNAYRYDDLVVIEFSSPQYVVKPADSPQWEGAQATRYEFYLDSFDLSIPKPENEVEAQDSENEVIYYTPTEDTIGFDLYDEVEGVGKTNAVKTYLGTTQEIKDALIADGYTLVETYEPNIGIEVPAGNELVIYNLIGVTATTDPTTLEGYWKELHIFDLVSSEVTRDASSIPVPEPDPVDPPDDGDDDTPVLTTSTDLPYTVAYGQTTRSRATRSY